MVNTRPPRPPRPHPPPHRRLFPPRPRTHSRPRSQRGARIIALNPHPVAVVVDLIRTTCSNDHIYAEQCNFADPADIQQVCAEFLKRDNIRIDGLVFAHEYPRIGSIFGTAVEDERNSRSPAFLITTLLLPALLVVPVERDIRIVNVVNPFYAAAAAAAKRFNPAFNSKKSFIFLSEGLRSLRTISLTHHL